MTTAWDRVVIATPTVCRRAESLAATRAEWERAGAREVVAVCQPSDWPLCPQSQRRNAHRAIAAALDHRPGATHVIFAEDDILVEPRFGERLPALLAAGVPITLFVAARYHYPAGIRRLLDAGSPLDEAVVPIVNGRIWVGSLGLILPRSVAEASQRGASEYVGWDVHLREFLRASGQRLYLTVPNLVQHRDTESTTGSHRGVVSVTYGYPVEGR